jgi:predicted metalloprotease
LQNLLALFGGNQQVQQQGGPVDPAEEKLKKFSSIVFEYNDKVWSAQFKKLGKTWVEPKLVLFSGDVDSGCGHASAAMGPFYCPADESVYIDLSFYRVMDRDLGARGEFARAYVIAHEVGHHVQHLLGYSKRANASGENENRRSVRLELQADYFAGVWAHYGQQKFNFLEEGDIESALNAANQIGDDTLQRKAQGRVQQEKFTHGSSEQRVRWFRKGFQTGDVAGASELFTRPYDKL